MRKIPTLFLRDPENPKLVTRAVNQECQWVLNGEGRPTVKYDGSACLVHLGVLYRRHRHRAEKGDAPPGWLHWDFDPLVTSGHGWMPVDERNPADRWHIEAWSTWYAEHLGWPPEGTYELVGPKSNGNHHRLTRHELWRHGTDVALGWTDAPLGAFWRQEPVREYDALWTWLGMLPCEGIVWHHEDGRMAKLKRRDFGHSWPTDREALDQIRDAREEKR